MKVKALKTFNDGWEKCFRHKDEVFEAPEKAVEYWQGLGLVEESNENEAVSLDRMNKAQLIEYAKSQGLELDESLTKKELIEQINELVLQ